MSVLKIPLNKGLYTIVDADNYEWLSQYTWYSAGHGYAMKKRYIGVIDGKKKQEMLYMHRMIMDAPKGMDVDHIDGDKLNNTKSNLRVCSRSQNRCNQKKKRKHSSKYKGISWYPKIGKWAARIGINGNTMHLGVFTSEDDAAIAYNTEAIKLFGEYANINVI